MQVSWLTFIQKSRLRETFRDSATSELFVFSKQIYSIEKKQAVLKKNTSEEYHINFQQSS